MNAENGLVYAAILDGTGGATEIDWDGVRSWTAGDGPLWVHLQRGVEEADRWLREESGIDQFTVQALMEDDPRPRTSVVGDGILAILRGVNLNPGSDPEDMVSIRVFTTGERVISLRMRKVLSVDSMREDLDAGTGARTAPGVLWRLSEYLAARVEPVIEGIEDRLGVLEGAIGEKRSTDLRRDLHQIRREAIAIRRYMAPQREAISKLAQLETPLIIGAQRGRLREVADRTMRYVEDLDAVRDRTAVLQDELTTQMAEQMNRTMYLLTVVATIMLPLGFLTGLLGINVGGIPGSDSPWA
ncbi:MAG: zinc transporter ZntB [Proteobacteria bacterium]|nr:zinc transporter ZntB [Pseudomonadota bacterium]